MFQGALRFLSVAKCDYVVLCDNSPTSSVITAFPPILSHLIHLIYRILRHFQPIHYHATCSLVSFKDKPIKGLIRLYRVRPSLDQALAQFMLNMTGQVMLSVHSTLGIRLQRSTRIGQKQFTGMVETGWGNRWRAVSISITCPRAIIPPPERWLSSSRGSRGAIPSPIAKRGLGIPNDG